MMLPKLELNAYNNTFPIFFANFSFLRLKNINNI